MEENVALDKTKQKKFVKSIKGIKKLIKKSNENEKSKESKKDDQQKAQKPFSMRIKHGHVQKKKRKPRGLVYLSHIPHGFYEHQMTEYFKQFGVVTNARVIRSKRTGNSKGYAFVEFKEPSVGEIVAETMNNYLMGKRLIKAAYIPPEKQKRAFRKRWNSIQNPTAIRRSKLNKAFNTDKDEIAELKKARKLLATLNKTKKKLSEMGINYDHFTPVDIPEALLANIVKQEKDDSTEAPEIKQKTKKEKKAEKLQATGKTIEDKNVAKRNEKTEANKVEKESKKPIKKVTENDNKEKVSKKGNKKGKVQENVNQEEQNVKNQKLKDVGVKPLEDFMKVVDDSNDSDSSYAFDSDEYEKVLEQDDEDLSSGESEDDIDDDDEVDDDDDEDSEEELPPKQKGKPAVPHKQGRNKPASAPKVPQPPQAKKQGKQQELNKLPQKGKRNAPQKSQGSPKKPKFEKQNQKPMKKQFKKK